MGFAELITEKGKIGAMVTADHTYFTKELVLPV